MTQSLKEILLPQLKRHEGLRLHPYKCPEDKWTIGYGRNLEDNGISEDEAETLLANDVDGVIRRLQSIPSFNALEIQRQAVLANMAFQMGFAGVMRFKNMWAAIEKQDYEEAAAEMLNSRWAGQTPNRASELARVMAYAS